MTTMTDHDFAYVKADRVVEGNEEVWDPPFVGDPVEPVSVEEYIERMSYYGWQFCGSFPYKEGFTVVMKREHDPYHPRNPIVYADYDKQTIPGRRTSGRRLKSHR